MMPASPTVVCGGLLIDMIDDDAGCGDVATRKIIPVNIFLLRVYII